MGTHDYMERHGFARALELPDGIEVPLPGSDGWVEIAQGVHVGFTDAHARLAATSPIPIVVIYDVKTYVSDGDIGPDAIECTRWGKDRLQVSYERLVLDEPEPAGSPAPEHSGGVDGETKGANRPGSPALRS